MFKVTWATLCGVHSSGVGACAWLRRRLRMYAYVWTTARMCAWLRGRLRMYTCVAAWTSSDVRVCVDKRANACVRMRGCVHYGTVETFARGRVYGLVATHVRITHRLNFMDDCVIWPNYTDNRMQPKAKAMQLKVKGMHLKMEAWN